MNRFHRLAYVLFSTSALVLTAADLTGPGHINLIAPAAPGPIPTFTDASPRFVWSGNSDNFLFIGRPLSLGYGNISNWDVGYPATPGINSVAIGGRTYAADNSVALSGSAAGSNGVALGAYSRVWADGGTAMGSNATAGPFAIAVGYGAGTGMSGAISIGSGTDLYLESSEFTYAHHTHSIAIGTGAWAYGDQSVSIGQGSRTNSSSSIAVRGRVWGVSSIAIGNTSAVGNRTIAMGDFTNAMANEAVALGTGVMTSALGGVSLGRYNTDKRKDGAFLSPIQAHALDPVFSVGDGVSDLDRSNVLTVYRDGSVRLRGAVELRAADGGYVTLEPGATGGRVFTLPTTDGSLLANNSPIATTQLSGEISATQITSLPWSKVTETPASLAAYGINDGISVARNSEGRITTAIRIEPQGDILMLGQTP